MCAENRLACRICNLAAGRRPKNRAIAPVLEVVEFCRRSRIALSFEDRAQLRDRTAVLSELLALLLAYAVEKAVN